LLGRELLYCRQAGLQINIAWMGEEKKRNVEKVKKEI